MKVDFYKKENNNSIRCLLCPHKCRILENQTGICNVRKNIDGTLISLNTDYLAAMHIDPIEKKPLYHFFPGEKTLSVSCMGCNFRCFNCQNHTISQVSEHREYFGDAISSEKIIESTLKNNITHITFTYTEPTVYYEFMLKTAQLASEHQLNCSIVSNGYINTDPLLKLIPYIKGANIDYKFASEELYRTISGGSPAPVLNTIQTLFNNKIITEVTSLIIEGLNDHDQEFNNMAESILSISDSIPWHLSAFYPTYKMLDRNPTSPDTLIRLRNIAKSKGLKHVYTGNIIYDIGQTTFCHKCGSELVNRSRFSSSWNKINNGKCLECGTEIYGLY